MSAPWYARWLGPVARFLFPDPEFAAASGSPLHEEGLPAHATYSPRNARSAMVFPWVGACVTAIATDLSGVPLVQVQTRVDGEREIDRAAPMLSLFESTELRRQLYADYLLTGNAFLRVIGPRGSATAVCVVLDPGITRPLIEPDSGEIVAYEWGRRKLPAAEVLHIRAISVGTGIHRAMGHSPIHSLHEGLVASRESRRHASRSAKRGRFEMLLAPSELSAQFGDSATQALKDRYAEAAASGDGVLVLNKAVKATPMSFSPRELEFAELDSRVRDETLAFFGVPPTRIGLPGANYGTAKQQARGYAEQLIHIARLFDDKFSELLSGNRRIEHDFTRFEALQTSATERQMRASVWVTTFGVEPKAAAAYEGFHDAPIPAGQDPAGARAPRRPSQEIDEPRERGIADALAAHLATSAQQYQAACADGDVPALLQMIEQSRLAQALESAGMAPEQAKAWAAEVAALVHEAVVQYAASRGAEGVLGIATLHAFSTDHARRLARVVSEAA